MSIRAQLAWLALAAMLPLAALQAWTLYAGAERDAEQARGQAMQLAQITASGTAGFLGQAQNILHGLAARPAVRALDPARCDPILKDFLALAPRFANVATMTLDGGVVCSAAPMTRPARMDPAKFLARLRAPGELTVGAITPGTITGRWAIPVGLALPDGRGGIAGAVGLAIDLVHLPLHPDPAGMPAGAVVGIVAADGTVLAHSAAPERFVGTNNRERPETRRLLAEKHGTAEETGLDGLRRVRAYTPIPGTDWIAVASLPAEPVYAPARARAAQSTVIALAVLVAAVLLAIRFGRAIGAPIDALGRTAREVAAGNLAARAPAGGPREIAEVGAQFNRMLEARAGAERALRESEAGLREVLDNMFPFVGLLSLDGRVLEANRAPLEAAGLAREDVIGKPCADAWWFSYSPEVQERLRGALARAARGEVVRYDETIRVAGGRFMAIDLMFSPLRDAAGAVARIVGSAADITERKSAETRRLAYAKQLERMSRRLLETEEAERRALSRELHDRIGQNLATLSLNLNLIRAGVAPHARAEVLARIDDAQEMVEATTRQARDLMAELHPAALDDFGLAAALRAHAEPFAARVGLQVAVEGEDYAPRLASPVELALFRIGQEALANAAKHAKATRVNVRVSATRERVALTVSDNGRGFDPAQADSGATWGLTIMRERAAAAGVELSVDSARGRGTRVRVEAPRSRAGAA